jgi:hypothetical protein
MMETRLGQMKIGESDGRGLERSPGPQASHYDGGSAGMAA